MIIAPHLTVDRRPVLDREIADLHEGIDEEAQPRLGGQTASADMRRVDETEIFEIAHHIANGSGRERHRQEPRQIARAERLAARQIGFHDATENFARALIQRGCDFLCSGIAQYHVTPHSQAHPAVPGI
ncbi:hypothetical protein D9M70_529820 [compost metagenome]